MSSTLAIDLVILLSLLEWPVLLWLTRGLRRQGRLVSFAPWPLLRLLLPGLCLLGVARTLSSDQHVPETLAMLALAGLAHSFDLWSRFQQER